MSRKNVQTMQGERERHMARIMSSDYVEGEFTCLDVVAHLGLTESCASQYLSQLVKRKQLTSERRESRNYYRKAIPSQLSVAWVPENGIPLGRFFHGSHVDHGQEEVEPEPAWLQGLTFGGDHAPA